MIQISDATAEQLVDFLSLLGDYLRADPHHSPAIAAHAEAVRKELEAKWRALPA